MKTIIETKRLILRPWHEKDAEALYKYASDPRVGLIAGWPPHTSIEHSREIIHTVLSNDEIYAVILKKTGEPIGSIGLIRNARTYSVAMGNSECEIGYWIGVPYWGQGLIPEAIGELLQHAFQDLPLNVVWCEYYDGNEQSRRVQEKTGFRYHHTETDKPCPMLNERRTVHFSKITKDEFLKKYARHK
ncbi:MAG: GNAT family N-acetyltransferase [Prevotella sp.]|jgi:RimJ/RimL family protein N-acetyltransferase|nr:GNAT family N-acetyltransferase [Prevotella sp.]